MAEAGGTAVDTTLSMLQRLPEATPHCAVLARPRGRRRAWGACPVHLLWLPPTHGCSWPLGPILAPLSPNTTVISLGKQDLKSDSFSV